MAARCLKKQVQSSTLSLTRSFTKPLLQWPSEWWNRNPFAWIHPVSTKKTSQFDSKTAIETTPPKNKPLTTSHERVLWMEVCPGYVQRVWLHACRTGRCEWYGIELILGLDHYGSGFTWIKDLDRWWKIGGRHQILTLHFWGNDSWVMPSSESCSLVWGLFVGTKFQASQTHSKVLEWNKFRLGLLFLLHVSQLLVNMLRYFQRQQKNKTKRSDVRVMCFGKGDGTSEHDTWIGIILMKFICYFFVYLHANLQSLYRTAQVVATNFWLRRKTPNSSCTGKQNFQVKEVIKTNINPSSDEVRVSSYALESNVICSQVAWKWSFSVDSCS